MARDRRRRTTATRRRRRRRTNSSGNIKVPEYVKSIGTKLSSLGLTRKKSHLLSVLLPAVFIVVGLFVYFFYVDFKNGLAYNEFRVNIEAENYVDARLGVEKLSSALKSKYADLNSSSSEYLPSAQERQTYLENLVQVLDNFKSNKHFPALKALKSILANQQNKMTFSTKSKEMEFNKIIRSDLKDLIEKFKAYKKRELTYPKQIRDNKERINQQVILAEDLATEFGNLMSLAPNNLKGERNQAKFYKEGILKGLPTLRRIPDNIPDLNTLKQELDLAGGKVNIRGKNAREIFEKKVARLREKGAVFTSQIINLQEENEKMQKELDELGMSLEKVTQKFEKALVSYLLEYTKPA